MGAVAAVGLGASSGRAMLGRVGPNELTVHPVARFGNNPVRMLDALHSNILELYRQVLGGLRAAVREEPTLRSAVVDSWAVDYALLRGNRMLANPYHYRDERTGGGLAVAHAPAPRAELYARNGPQFLPFDTLYQLTGRKVAKRTNTSTTGLLDIRTCQWNHTLIARLGLPPHPVPHPRRRREQERALAARGRERHRRHRSLGVVTVGSHDTASAAVAVPMTSADYTHILRHAVPRRRRTRGPVLSEASRLANFTNEGGVDGRVRYLRNVMGLWLLSESIRTWECVGTASDLAALLAAAAHVPPGTVTEFDVEDPRFLAPGDMPTQIAAHCRTPAHRPKPSAASSRASPSPTPALQTAADLSGKEIHTIHIIGGGSQNQLLCQVTADRTGLPVLAGPVEVPPPSATSWSRPAPKDSPPAPWTTSSPTFTPTRYTLNNSPGVTPIDTEKRLTT